jgi:septum formation protein
VKLVLASTSPYRATLLERLGIPFDAAPPHVEEALNPGESPPDCAQRLADAKCEALQAEGRVVIGSDQVADLEGRILGKPGNHAAALQQLSACQGQSVRFHTAVTIAGQGRRLRHLDETRVLFRRLPEQALDQYLRLEQPYDCAGGFKAEGLGIRLLQRIESEDPTALIGLPLIWVADAMAHFGFDALARQIET